MRPGGQLKPTNPLDCSPLIVASDRIGAVLIGQVVAGPADHPISPTKWREFAAKCAIDAHVNWFSSRHVTWPFEDLDIVVLYNNNPNGKYPDLRDKELAEFRYQLADNGTGALGFGVWPVPGAEDGGYTYAIVLDVPAVRDGEICDMMEAIIRKLAPK